MNNKFLNLYESVSQRYQKGGVLVGDYVKFIDGFKSHDDYKELPENVKEMIEDMLKSGLNIRVVNTKPFTPTLSPGNVQDIGQKFSADIAVDHGGGRLVGYLSVPTSLIIPDNAYPNLNPLANSQRRKDKVQIKPKEVEQSEEHPSNLSDPGTGKLRKSDISKANKNTTLKGAKGEDPAVKGSYTKNYLAR
ncbi:MAG: hypothetical protein EBU90_30075 [Proteobacteria bacterium]|nr:hypothetical protein [Pseudomonadota bacterium]